MPHSTATTVIDEAIRRAVQEVVGKVSRTIAATVSRAVEDGLISELGRLAGPAAAGPRGTTRRPRRATEDITRWVADRRARRVPNFVIKATGLDTKKKIVARFGEAAAFEVGKALPAVKTGTVAAVAAAKAVPKLVKATPPTVRKAAGKKQQPAA
jgi:hypothetical protein